MHQLLWTATCGSQWLRLDQCTGDHVNNDDHVKADDNKDHVDDDECGSVRNDSVKHGFF